MGAANPNPEGAIRRISHDGPVAGARINFCRRRLLGKRRTQTVSANVIAIYLPVVEKGQ
jgi:hypothetical protein